MALAIFRINWFLLFTFDPSSSTTQRIWAIIKADTKWQEIQNLGLREFYTKPGSGQNFQSGLDKWVVKGLKQLCWRLYSGNSSFRYLETIRVIIRLNSRYCCSYCWLSIEKVPAGFIVRIVSTLRSVCQPLNVNILRLVSLFDQGMYFSPVCKFRIYWLRAESK